jgi:hypothetical protein
MSEMVILDNSDFEEKQMEEPERHYLPLDNFKFDWSMMLPDQENENDGVLDWNKLIYGPDQCLEFDLKKNEKLMRPEFYGYLFKKASERSEMEKFYLKQSGFCAYEEESDEDMLDAIREEQKIKRFIVDRIDRDNDIDE